MILKKKNFSIFGALFHFICLPTEFTLVYTKKDIPKIQAEISSPEYINDILPYDLSHCIALLHLAKDVQTDVTFYIRSVCKMYNNLSKQTLFFDAEMFVDFLHQFSLAMEFLKKQHSGFLIKSSKQAQASLLYEQLFGSFSAHYNQFKADPESFLRDIASNITTTTFSCLEASELEQNIVRFFEQAMSKLLWDDSDHLKAWSTTKQIADIIVSLSEKQIITDMNNVDDLLWSLTTRYNYFLSLFSETLSAETMSTIKHELNTKKLSLLSLDTPGAVMSRRSLLTRTIESCIIEQNTASSEQIAS